MRRKRSIVNDQSNLSYRVGNKIVYNTEVLKSNLCYCNDVSILVIGDITNYSHALSTQAAFRNCAPFINKNWWNNNRWCRRLRKPMYSLLDYSSNYSNTTFSLWFYSIGEASNFINVVEISNDSKSFRKVLKM